MDQEDKKVENVEKVEKSKTEELMFNVIISTLESRGQHDVSRQLKTNKENIISDLCKKNDQINLR